MEMEIGSGVIEAVTKSDILGLELASWNRQRSTEQLLGFIARREAEISAADSEA
jgi:hypothetical protein